MCKNEKFLKTFRNGNHTIRVVLNLKNLKKSVISSEVQFIWTNFALEITPKQTNVNKNKNKTVNIREFQLCAFVIMALLASSLVITTGRTGRAGHIYNKAQRLLTAGIVLLRNCIAYHTVRPAIFLQIQVQRANSGEHTLQYPLHSTGSMVYQPFGALHIA